MRKFTALKILLCSFAGMLIISCSVEPTVGKKLGLETDIKITLDADSDINPDEKNQPSPLAVRVYELKSDTLFGRADFIDLFDNDDQLLAADLIRKRELKEGLLIPGEKRVEEFVADRETRYIGLYAEFFQYQDSRYKVIFPVTANNIFRNKVNIIVSDNSIRLAK